MYVTSHAVNTRTVADIRKIPFYSRPATSSNPSTSFVVFYVWFGIDYNSQTFGDNNKNFAVANVDKMLKTLGYGEHGFMLSCLF